MCMTHETWIPCTYVCCADMCVLCVFCSHPVCAERWVQSPPAGAASGAASCKFDQSGFIFFTKSWRGLRLETSEVNVCTQVQISLVCEGVSIRFTVCLFLLFTVNSDHFWISTFWTSQGPRENWSNIMHAELLDLTPNGYWHCFHRFTGRYRSQSHLGLCGNYIRQLR